MGESVPLDAAGLRPYRDGLGERFRLNLDRAMQLASVSSAVALAGRSGLSEKVIRQILRRKTLPTSETILRLSLALGFNLWHGIYDALAEVRAAEDEQTNY